MQQNLDVHRHWLSHSKGQEELQQEVSAHYWREQTLHH